MTLAIAMTIAAAIGGMQALAAEDPCSLLTAADVTAIVGGPLLAPNSDAQSCQYSSTGTTWNGEDASAMLLLSGGRAEYEQSVGMGAKYGTSYAPLSGIGDKAYENNNCGDQCSQVGVLKKGTYFILTVQGDPKHAKSAVALARKVAARMK